MGGTIGFETVAGKWEPDDERLPGSVLWEGGDEIPPRCSTRRFANERPQYRLETELLRIPAPRSYPQKAVTLIDPIEYKQYSIWRA